MGVAGSDMHAAEQPAADNLLQAFTTIDEPGRHRHAEVLDYWLTIRGDREFPPLHDLDPLAICDAGPSSALLELIGGGEDAEVRHLGEMLKPDGAVERIIDSPSPSILASIGRKLSIVAISRNALSFEDQFASADTVTRCWVTLLPLSSAGAWVDYVYAFVTFETEPAGASEPAETVAESSPASAEAPEEFEQETETMHDYEQPDDAVLAEPETAAEGDGLEASEPASEAVPESAAESDIEAATESGPGFSDVLQTSTNADGFYGAQIVKRSPDRLAVPPSPVPSIAAASPPEAVASEDADERAGASVQPLHARLAEVRAKADEARMAKLRSNAALYDGLSAAYDFALDAEDSSEEYLKLVEAQGLKIKLRSPMMPVMKLAFGGMCDDATIARLEGVLAWALKQELPRGTLATRIEAAGGIAQILGNESAPA